MTATGEARLVEALRREHPEAGPCLAIVSIAEQQLRLWGESGIQQTYPVSTSRFGPGSQEDSHRTPLGLHRIARKIGAGAPPRRIFRARRDTGELAPEPTEPDGPDYITSRILWLEGLEPGRNRGPGIDSFARYIYIHGTAAEALVGQPASMGCVRMRNADVIQIYEQLPVGALVYIEGARASKGLNRPGPPL